MRRASAQLVEDALWTAARASIDRVAFERGALVDAICERSRRYTSARELLAAPLQGRAQAADLAARALFFTPADAGKLSIALAELDRAGRLPAGRVRLCDLGAGCGAMAFAVLDAVAVRGGSLAVTVIDRDDGALAILGAALPAVAAALGVPLELALRRETVTTAALPAGGFDLITAGHLMNELDEPSHLPLAARMLAALAPGGAAIVVEPALKDSARALHRLRDGLIARGAQVFAPCTRTVAPCPMLADPRDWCHEERPPALPERTGRLAVETGLRDSALKFAYLVYGREAAAQVALPAGRAALRVVSHPAREKGKTECAACGATGLSIVRLLRRHRSAANRGFERARRGDLLLVDATLGGARVELAGDSDVELVALPRDDRDDEG